LSGTVNLVSSLVTGRIGVLDPEPDSDDHPSTLRSAPNLATDLCALGEHEQTRQLEEWIESHDRS
jgi:hypothetical protein